MNNEKRLYYAYSDYLKNKYGQKVYKLPVNVAFVQNVALDLKPWIIRIPSHNN